MNRQENAAFIAFDNGQNGLIFDDSNHPKYPIRYYNVISGQMPMIRENCSYYGYVYEGSFNFVPVGSPPAILTDGMFFSIAGQFEVMGAESARFVLVEVEHTKGIYPETNYRAYPMFGGPIEQTGRLKYIDGCTDSLLISPIKLGDPCLNHLHFPKDIVQTQHTHPSHRIGIVADGEGKCITPFGVLPLTKGMIFVIKEYDGIQKAEGIDGQMYSAGQHSFDTEESHMDVIAFHPDSDFGATDSVHPMINRTIVGGTSASELTDIQTK